MIRVLDKVIDIILGIIFTAAIILMLLLVGVRLFGLAPYVVTSGSMEPVYPVGSIVYAKDVPAEQLVVGDDITFYLDQDVVATHRIGEIYPKEGEVQTYGVNNIDSEGNHINDARTVDFDQIIGKVKYSIPMVGFVYLFLRTTYGKIAVLIIVLALFTSSQAIKYLKKERKK